MGSFDLAELFVGADDVVGGQLEVSGDRCDETVSCRAGV
jgi:hypothetical protein